MKDPVQTQLIGIDWGTTRLRALRIGSDGEVLEHRESDRGIAAIRDGEFDSALQSLIGDWQAVEREKIPIIMCGMVGSRQDWREVPYCSCPASLHDLVKDLQAIDTSLGPAWIVGGLSSTDERGDHDILRGEEMQIFGVASPMGQQVIVAAGTHSKWALVRDLSIERFHTYMTGELYATLKQHSILGWLMQGEATARGSPEDDMSSLEGGAALA